MSMPTLLDFRRKLLTDSELVTSVKRVLRARGVQPQDLHDKSQDTLLSALRATNLPTTDREARQYVNAIARYEAIDWAHQRREDPVQLALEMGAEAGRANDGEAGPPHDRADVEYIAASPNVCAEEDAREKADWVSRAAERAKHEHPRSFQLFWRTQMLDERAVDIAAAEGISAGRVRRYVADVRESMRKKLEELTVVFAVFFVLFGVVRVLMQRREAPQHPPDSHTAAPEGPTPLDQATMLRQRGLRACDGGRWTDCVEQLDEAKRLDPAGEADERVQEARARANAAQAAPLEERNPPPRFERDIK